MFATAITLVVFLSVSCCNGTELQEVSEAARKRYSSADRFRIEWTEQDTIFAETQLGDMTIQPGMRSMFPKTDEVIKLKCSLAVDGDNRRFERSGPMPIAKEHAFYERKYVSTFNGTIGKNYYSGNLDRPESVTPVGFIRKEEQAWESMIPDICAPLTQYRTAGATLEGYTLERDRVVLDGEECLVLSPGPGSDDPHFAKYWIDLTDPHNIRRVMWYSRGKPTLTLDIKYSTEAAASTLAGWRGIIFSGEGGKMLRQIEATVTRFELNPKFEPDTFLFQYPVDTEVIDYRDDSSYIVQPDGKKRVITEEERLRGAYLSRLH